LPRFPLFFSTLSLFLSVTFSTPENRVVLVGVSPSRCLSGQKGEGQQMRRSRKSFFMIDC
jgi:hypothetical protein